MFRKITGSVLLGAFLLWGGTTFVHAENYKIDLSPATDMKEILLGNIGKTVLLKTVNGDIEGRVTKVGNSLVHISRVSRLEYYDAVISIDKISAVLVRARESLKN